MTRTAICTSLLLLASLVMAQEKAQSHAESLVKALTAFHVGMAAESAEVRKRTLSGVLPSRKDMVTLFPEHVGLFWERLEAHNKSMVEHVDDVAREATRGELIEIEAIDVRQNDESGVYAAVLKIIPKNIPVFRAVRKTKRGSAGSSSYLFIGGRWVHLQGLEMIPNIIFHSKKRK